MISLDIFLENGLKKFPIINEVKMVVLPGMIQKAPAGAKGFDTSTIVTPAVARKFRDDGFTFCIRYLSLFSTDDEVADGDLIREEADDILNSGLALMAVQHVRNPGWIPTASKGTQTGNHAANNAIFAGLPVGMNIWLDLEGILVNTPDSNIIDYCNNWFAQVSSVGYVPGIYLGFDELLSGDQLFHSLTCQHYWKSPSFVPDVAVRGYQMTQPEINKIVHGINIDVDITQNDLLGGKRYG
jgi:Domain of unknown function (DUF1906)